MSQENVEIVRFGFEAVARGDLATVEEYLAPRVVIVQPPEIPDSKTYEGRKAVVDLLEDWPREWEDFRFELLDLIDFSDDTVVGVLRQSGRGRESGIEMDYEVFYVHRIHNRKLTRLEMFFTREQALEAAGRSEQDTHADS